MDEYNYGYATPPVNNGGGGNKDKGKESGKEDFIIGPEGRVAVNRQEDGNSTEKTTASGSGNNTVGNAYVGSGADQYGAGSNNGSAGGEGLYRDGGEQVITTIGTGYVSDSKTRKRVIRSFTSVFITFAIIGVVIYAALYAFVLFPKAENAIMSALEAKLDIDTDFNFRLLANEGTLSLSYKAPDSNGGAQALSKADLTFSYKKNSAYVSAGFNDERLNAYLSDKEIAASIDSLNGGQYYGFPLKDLIESIEKSVFGPGSGYKYAIDKEVFDKIKGTLESLDGKKDEGIADDVMVIYTELMKVVRSSDVCDTTNSYFGFEVLGVKRSGKSQTYDIDQKDIKNLYKDLSNAFTNPSEKLETAMKNVYAELNPDSEKPLNMTEIAVLLENASKEAASQKFNLKITVGYVGRTLSAVVAELKANAKTKDGIVFVLDFGEDPKKDSSVLLHVKTTSSYTFEEKTYTTSSSANGIYTLTNENDRTVAKFSLSSLVNEDGEVTARSNISAALTLDKKAQKATAEYSTKTENPMLDGYLSMSEETSGYIECDYSDSRDKWSITPVKVELTDEDGEKTVFDIKKNVGEITIALGRRPQLESAPKYENILAMNASEMDSLIEDIKKLGEKLAEKYSGMLPPAVE